MEGGALMEERISNARLIDSPYVREALGETARQCTATAKGTGERCTRSAILGGFVCPMHGGKVPVVMKTARERLLAMCDPALDALFRVLKSHGPACEVCGRSDGDRDPAVIRAAQIVLDRTGFGPSAHLTVAPSLSQSSPVVEWMTAEQLSVMDAIFEDASRRMQVGESKQNNSLESDRGGVTKIEVVVIDSVVGMIGDGR